MRSKENHVVRGWLCSLLYVLASPVVAQGRHPPISPPPIVRVSPETSTEVFGSWSVGKFGENFSIATTANQGQSVLGVMCDYSGCVTFFNPHITCEDKASYPALINSPGGAFSDNLTCRKIGDNFVYALSSENPVIEAMSIGGTLGVAFPMQSGEFTVSRFSLTGGARAYARAAQLVHAPIGAQTGDVRL